MDIYLASKEKNICKQSSPEYFIFWIWFAQCELFPTNHRAREANIIYAPDHFGHSVENCSTDYQAD